ncbi:hypothetical protein [Streptomyces sp. NPDC002088]|uniref:hypothetical protein n=1 Tax=Streptomyces sp. NPDC002088 TaxID=3154665 RepID=UPI003333D788
MTRTTPPRPADVTAVFPSLARLARTATRLHPRPGSPSRHDSSIGGPLLWPASRPWPHCNGPHEPDAFPATSPADERLLRQILTAARDRPRSDTLLTPQEQAAVERITAGRPWPEGPVSMLPVAQLYARDVPALRPPGSADLLQVLWCPFDHPPENMPGTTLFWRSAALVTDILTAPPEPTALQYPGYLLEPCLIDPEQVTEYPAPLELRQDLRSQVQEWSARQKAGAEPGSVYDQAKDAFYQYELSVAPGWKVGGWAPWSFTDPRPQYCSACGTPMEPLLTIASTEWSDSEPSWIPYEDQAAASAHTAHPDPANPAMVSVGRGYNQQIYTCPAAPEHPHAELMQ